MREMTRETKEKLRRYLINADPFLWNVLTAKNKKGRIPELQEMGYLADYTESSNPTYEKVNQDLLVELGIEGILEKIVVPKVKATFSPEIIAHFRRCWEQGQTPTFQYIRQHGLYRKRYRSREVYEEHFHYEEPPVGYKDQAFIFLQIETQQNFVERWTVFAGLWFEEIEPLLD